MRGPRGYVGTALLLALLLGAIAGLVLPEEGARGARFGVTVAALAQGGFFIPLWRAQGDSKRLLLARASASLGRLVVIAATVTVVATGWIDLPPAPTLLALVGLMTGLLFLEPLFLSRERLQITNRAAER